MKETSQLQVNFTVSFWTFTFISWCIMFSEPLGYKKVTVYKQNFLKTFIMVKEFVSAAETCAIDWLSQFCMYKQSNKQSDGKRFTEPCTLFTFFTLLYEWSTVQYFYCFYTLHKSILTTVAFVQLELLATRIQNRFQIWFGWVKCY